MPRSIEQLVQQQIQQSELRRRRSGGQLHLRPVLTISRGMGSGARVVADRLSHDLGWSLWDKDLLDNIAKAAGVSRRVAEAIDERTISEIDVLVRANLGEADVGSFDYYQALGRAVTSIAKLGNAIILGRGAHFLVRDALRVRLDASEDVRVANMMKYEDLDEKSAREKVRRSDRERQAYLVRLFGKELVERQHFDVTLWMDRITVEGAVAIISAALHDRFPHAFGTQRRSFL